VSLLCKYHPTRPAHFHCPDCGDYYCPDCVEVKKTVPLGTAEARRCIRCGSEVEWVGVGNLIEPLTARLPKIFLYGLAPWPLALNVLLTLGNFIFSLPSLYFFLIRLALFALLVKYAFAALRATARGTLTPPPAWGDSVTTDFSPVFKQCIIFVVVGAVAGYVGAQAGIAVGVLFALASLAYLPAMVIMLAATDSLVASLNPLRFGPLAFRVGRDYLLMYFFLSILLGAPAALWSAFLQHLPSGAGLLLAQLAGNYYMIIAYHLMGYVILLHHRDIGYELHYDEFREAGKPGGAEEKSPQQELLARANVMIKEGAADEALQLIQTKTRYEQLTDAGLAECYFDLVQLKKRADLLKDRGAEFFRLFFDAQRRQKAGEAYAALSALDPTFCPEAGELFKVAGWLVESGRYREALSAYSRFIKANPNHDLTVQAYFTCARLLNERLGKPQKAKEVLDWIEKKHPLHELMPHVRTYRDKVRPGSAPAGLKEP
jgi:tetratricopeptide (TPR) repeat protein